jgi:excisionase family DNA binding protein
MTARARRSSGGGTETRRHGAGDRHNRIQLFTIAEAAQMLRVGPRTVRRRIASGDLVAHRFGGCVRIAEADLRAFLAIHRRG